MVSVGGGISLLPQNTVLNENQISKFYIKELQTTSISMWISKDTFSSDYLVLKNIVERVINNGY
ncbi:hypothetical protein SAMN02746066_01768 [Anaerosporobacter mobilis DSM 15930]|jgi:hypothetical protein|uniref:LysR substrate binding domain-containing protein n=1 Tax=Anaerosporobacter mobilis DSM 15930 TaxID=1120996 RepID=A0A1M7IAZ9_9FIRM|nr:hypothetical protein [Anaerosporobacter mobilis]SHM37971.1 hypothetical protein SAMN02746066_01768 [Anaerosporobacter mobilis DSM 15930]